MLIMLIIRYCILTIFYSQFSMSQTLLSQSRFYFEEFSLDTFLVLFALRILLSQTTDILEKTF